MMNHQLQKNKYPSKLLYVENKGDLSVGNISGAIIQSQSIEIEFPILPSYKVDYEMSLIPVTLSSKNK